MKIDKKIDRKFQKFSIYFFINEENPVVTV